MEGQAFQDEITNNYCWGCGALNDEGLRIKSYWEENEAVCTWKPEPAHMAGPRHILNGGIIATLIDCHCVCTAIAAAARAEGRPLRDGSDLWYATASLKVTYLRPTPVDVPVVLRAQIAEMGPRKTVVICSVFAGSEVTAQGEVIAVRVPPDWRGL